MNEKQLSALRIWHEAVTESEKEIDALIEIGFRPESRLFTAINNALEALTAATSQIVGDESGWLDWYWLDCRMGRNPLEAGFSDDLRKICTLDDLIWLLEGDE